MVDALVICAGKGTRMGNTNTPKSLTHIKNIPNLYNTINILDKHVNNIHIVINKNELDIFKTVLDNVLHRINFILLDDQLGSGDAVLKSLDKIIDSISEHSLIIWGDVYIPNDHIINEVIKHKTESMIMPVIYESDPYFTFTYKNDDIIKSDFSKPDHGYHDQSIFLINSQNFYNHLKTIYNAFWDGSEYTTNTKDLNFMIIIQYLNNINKNAKFYITTYKTYGFNTQEEAKQINDFYNMQLNII